MRNVFKAALVTALSAGSGMAEAQTPIPPAPRDFVLAAAQSDQYEVLAARVAEIQSQDAGIRAFAQAMIQDHTRLTAALRQAALAAGLQVPPPAMSSDQAALLSALQSLRGAEFDKAYVRQQVLAHTQAMDVEDSFGAAGGEPHLKDAAQAALPTIKDHLQKAQQLQAKLGG